MKRITAILLAVLMAACFAGCGVKSAKPAAPQGEGKAFTFTSRDLEGSEAASKDIFAENKITMVNIWATWCGPCLRELPELQELSSELSGLGCGLIGLLEDVGTESEIAEAKKVVSSNGLTYPIILSNDEVRSQIDLQYLPTTIFVDSSGRIVGEPIIGARVDSYLPAVRALLQADSD